MREVQLPYWKDYNEGLRDSMERERGPAESSLAAILAEVSDM